jgi:hypothetical protein
MSFWRRLQSQADRGGDEADGAAAVFSARQRWLLLAAFAGLVMLRIPLAWWHGRFLGEEGTIFFAYAWHRPPAEALWRSFAGYLNLGASATTLAAASLVRAGWLPLEQAPRLTMAAALLFQLVPAGLVLTARGAWLADRRTVIACLALIVTAPMTEEVFGNVLHIQFHLALAAGLVLAFELPRGRAARIAVCAPLLLAPLCGPGAIVLLPLFALRTLIDRSPARLMQTLVLGAGAAAQMLLFYVSNPMRGHLLDPLTLANVLFVRLAVLPTLSAPLAPIIGRAMNALTMGGGIGMAAMTAVSLAWLAWLARAALGDGLRARLRGGLRGGFDAGFWLILAGLALAAASYGVGMLASDPSQLFNVGSGERYNFLPLVLIGVGLVAIARRPGGRDARVARMLVRLALLSGTITFFIPIKDMRSGPDWQREVGLWRRDHDYALHGWPRKWRVDLSDHDRPCSPPGPAAVPTDPLYCEGNWQALVQHDSRIKWLAPPPH